MDASCLPCLVVKMLIREGSFLVWDGSVCCNQLGSDINLWTTGTVGQQFVLSFHCVKFMLVISSVSLSVSFSL